MPRTRDARFGLQLQPGCGCIARAVPCLYHRMSTYLDGSIVGSCRRLPQHAGFQWQFGYPNIRINNSIVQQGWLGNFRMNINESDHYALLTFCDDLGVPRETGRWTQTFDCGCQISLSDSQCERRGATLRQQAQTTVIRDVARPKATGLPQQRQLQHQHNVTHGVSSSSRPSAATASSHPTALQAFQPNRNSLPSLPQSLSFSVIGRETNVTQEQSNTVLQQAGEVIDLTSEPNTRSSSSIQILPSISLTYN